MAIHKYEGNFVIASQGVWLPGVYESTEAANYAFQFPDEVLSALQNSANDRGDRTITMDDLKAARKREHEGEE